jgi:hypothetical protein
VQQQQEVRVPLPLLLAGPILRRVEPTLVSVWVALSQPARVRLSVWESRVLTGSSNPLIPGSVNGVHTLRVGDKLHIALATLKPANNSAQMLQAGRLYSYDIEITVDGQTLKETLATLRMLESGVVDGQEHVPLGYEPGFLPSFALPPAELENLRMVFGSCRRIAHPNPDAMVWIDDMIEKDQTYKDPLRRPHQMLLGGDQIYADDVSSLQMLRLSQVAVELIGVRGTAAAPLERIALDEVLQRSGIPAPDNPLAAYVDAPAGTPQERALTADRAHFPEGKRLHLTRRAAQMTSHDGDSHLISFGEFAAMYLSVWSAATWDTLVPLTSVVINPAQSNTSRALAWEDNLPPTSRIDTPAIEFPDRIPKHLYPDPAEGGGPEAPPDPKELQDGLRSLVRRLGDFRKGLPKVQRALANIPTYMMFDDHEVTDDWNLNPIWRDRVMTTSLGVTIVRNALVSYALFQDWGNDPLKYETSDPHRQLLTHAQNLFPAAATSGPDAAAANALDKLFGFDLRGVPELGGRVGAVRPPVTWHFKVDGPKHRLIALDNRTRRSYATRNGPPGNVAVDVQAEQIGTAPLPGGRELLVVIAPLQVIGPPLVDELVAPLTYRIFDTVKGFQSGSALGPDSKLGERGMLGTNPDAIEAWCFDAEVFEALLKRLATFQKVVLLSGDVHYTASTAMSYWRGNATQPARIVQFTSSGLKNVMPSYIGVIDRSLGFAQQLVRAKLGVERIGWDLPRDNLVILPQGMKMIDLPPALRSRLQDTPVMIPTWGWPDLNPPNAPQRDLAKVSHLNDAFPPDWLWRARPLLDNRLDAQRPPAIRPLALDNDKIDNQLKDKATALDAYVSVAARHQNAVEKLKNSRQMLFRSNFGLVRFERRGQELFAIHEAYTAFADADAAVPEVPKPAPFMVHEASLGPPQELPPQRELRQYAIEPVKPGAV